MMLLTMLVDIAATVLRLVEAEGRVLRRAVMNVGWALVSMCVAAILALVAAGFFLIGLYQYFAALISPAAASLLVSLVAFVLTLIFAGLAKRLTMDPK